MAIVGGLCVLALVSGCAPAKKLLFTTYTKVGLDMSAANNTPTHVMLGYKRFEGALIPVDVPESSKDATQPEALSVFAAICLENGWFSGVKINQAFATGAAAERAAQTDQFGIKAILEGEACK